VTLESAIQNLADAINRGASVLEAAVAADKSGGAGGAPDTDPPAPRRGRPRKVDASPDAAAPGASSSADTDAPAPASTSAADAAAPAAPAAIDAGTGKPVELPAAGAIDRKAVKQKAGRLLALPDGNDKLTELLRRHSGVAEGEVKFGMVPDEALSAFEADIDSALALAD